ncbi:MAG: hypothetical protein IKZ87_01390 [Actinomycetaceae bacterium]|nr:hypothetical protein [Actinomycetaceae bacterium]
MIGYLIDVQNDKVSTVRTTGQLEDYYNKLNCSSIDVASRAVDGKYYDIIVDDESLCVDAPRISAIAPDGESMLAGNLLVLNCPDANDETGSVRGLTDEDVQRIAANVRRVTFRSGRIGNVLVCSY